MSYHGLVCALRNHLNRVYFPLLPSHSPRTAGRSAVQHPNEGWAYNDNVNSPMMQDWLGKTVDRDDLTRHDKWCCMMLPCLKLLRDLARRRCHIRID